MAQAPVSMAQPLPGRTASGPRTNRWTTRPRRRNSHETVEALYLVPFVLLNIVVYVFNVCGGSGSWGTGVSRRTTKGVFGDDATRAGSTRVVLRRRLGFVRGAGGLRNRFNSTRTTDAAPNISSVATRRAEAVDGSMMGCQCYSTASVVGRDTGRVDWISSMRRFIHRATAVASGEELDPRWLDVSAHECVSVDGGGGGTRMTHCGGRRRSLQQRPRRNGRFEGAVSL